MVFSTYKPIQIIVAYHYLAHLLKCYYWVQHKIEKCHLQIALLLILNHQKYHQCKLGKKMDQGWNIVVHQLW